MVGALVCLLAWLIAPCVVAAAGESAPLIASDSLRGRLEGHRSQPPGSEWRLTVAGAPAAAGEWELVAQNAMTAEQKVVASFSLPPDGGEAAVAFKLPAEGAWRLLPGRGGQIGPPDKLIRGLVVESSIFIPGPETADAVPAKLEFEGIFGNVGVLQHGQPLPVWGYAPPGREVVVTLANQKRSVTADDRGRWRVTFDPLTANSGPHELVAVAGEETAKVADLLVGEVWLFSGQSNMGGNLPASAGAEEFMASVNLPEVRTRNVLGEDSESAARLIGPGVWSRLAPDAKRGRALLPLWNAIAAGFGSEVHAALGMPVGVILAARGGTAIHCWTSLATQEKTPAFAPELQAFRDMKEKRWDLDDAARLFEVALRAWQEKAESAKARGEEVPAFDFQKTLAAGWNKAKRGVGSSGKGYKGPSAVHYDALIAPIAPYAIRGVAWYQGEADNGIPMRYREMLPAMIADWRSLWNEKDLPFLIVQLAPSKGDLPTEPPHPRTVTIKEVQARVAAEVPNCALVVSNDLPAPGNDIHYGNKFPVGVRLAAAALAKVYGKDVPASGPVYREMKSEGNRLRLFFDELHGGLKVDGDALRGFMVAGKDQVFHWADAELDGDTVLVGSAAVPEPVAARYAWDPQTGGNTLKNQAGLPAPSFRTDDWPWP